MNNILSVTIIGWDTRNAKRHKKALARCSDFGLKPVLHNLCIGNLYAKERSELFASLKGMFSRETDRLHMTVLCQSCFHSSPIGGKMKEQIMASPDFELVQVQLPEDAFAPRRRKKR